MQYSGQTYIKRLLVICLKFKYNWVFCTLFGNSTWRSTL